MEIRDEREDAVFGDGWRETSPLIRVRDENKKRCVRVCVPID